LLRLCLLRREQFFWTLPRLGRLLWQLLVQRRLGQRLLRQLLLLRRIMLRQLFLLRRLMLWRFLLWRRVELLGLLRLLVNLSVRSHVQRTDNASR
jgi:hypothetical protein